MYHSEIRAATVGMLPVEAVLTVLRTPGLETEYDGCTLGGLYMALDQFDRSQVCNAVWALIEARQAYFAEPLELADADSYVLLVRWSEGSSRRGDIERELGVPHGITSDRERVTLTYDLYVENVEDDYPLPPQPYVEREAANEYRPPDCTFPYTAIWPPEALQIQFVFDRAGVLASFDFLVAERLT